MDINKFKDIINGWIRDFFERNYRTGAPRVPPHTHNGIDNLPVANVVSQITPGSNITLSPASGQGKVTITSTGGGIEVKDGTTDVTDVTIMEFPSGSVTDNGGGDVSISVSATPAGSNDQIQFNLGSAFSADSAFKYKRVPVGFNFNFTMTLGDPSFDSGNGGTLVLVSNAGSGDNSSITSRHDLNIFVENILRFEMNSAASSILFLGNGFDTPNLGIGGTVGSPVFGSGQGVLGISDAITNPSTNPSGGGILYSSSGALHWLGSSGTDTVIAPA